MTVAAMNNETGPVSGTAVSRVQTASLDGQSQHTHSLVLFLHSPQVGKAHAVIYFSIPSRLVYLLPHKTTLTLQNGDVLLETFRDKRFGHVKLSRSLESIEAVLEDRIYLGFDMFDTPVDLADATLLNAKLLSEQINEQARYLLLSLLSQYTANFNGN